MVNVGAAGQKVAETRAPVAGLNMGMDDRTHATAAGKRVALTLTQLPTQCLYAAAGQGVRGILR